MIQEPSSYDQAERAMIPVSYTLSYDRHDPDSVRRTMQKLMERLVGLTIACGYPMDLRVDYHDFAPLKAKGALK